MLNPSVDGIRGHIDDSRFWPLGKLNGSPVLRRRIPERQRIKTTLMVATLFADAGCVEQFPLTVHRTSGPPSGRLFVSRKAPDSSTKELVRKALTDKLPKLCACETDARILLLETDSPASSEHEIACAIDELAGDFGHLGRVDEVWVADTTAWETERWVLFQLIRPCSLPNLNGRESR
jgi:hypothetical protein